VVRKGGQARANAADQDRHDSLGGGLPGRGGEKSELPAAGELLICPSVRKSKGREVPLKEVSKKRTPTYLRKKKTTSGLYRGSIRSENGEEIDGEENFHFGVERNAGNSFISVMSTT